MKKKPGDIGFWMRTAAVSAVVAMGLMAVVVRVSGNSPGSVANAQATEFGSDEKAATIEVTEGSGWLSTGDELQIAEWYSGSDHGDGQYFANFRGSDGGATVDLRLSGLNRSGTFACANPADSKSAASVELRVDVDNAYRSGLKAGTCKVTVTRLDGQVMEGRYTATLVNSGNTADELTINGKFRATRPQNERLSAASVAPTLSPRVAGL